MQVQNLDFPDRNDFLTIYKPYKQFVFKDHVKSVLRIFSAHNKHNCRDPTVGILIKLKLKNNTKLCSNLIKIPTVGSRQLFLL